MVDPISLSSSGGAQGVPSQSPSKPAKNDPAQALAFRALLDKLADRAQELERASSKPMNAGELAGAVDRAHESLQDALTLSEQLIESYRAAQQRSAATPNVSATKDDGKGPSKHLSVEAPRVASDAGRALALLEGVFGAHGDLARECPLVFEGEFDGSVVAIEVDGEVASACAILARDLVVGEQKLRAGFVGSVATEPRFRGRGLASRVLEEAEAELRSRGALFACLWADDARFYESRGWRAFGAELDVVVPQALASKLPSPVGVRSMVPVDVASVHALYRLHATRVDRTAAETAALLACPRMSALVRERAGEIVAYACMGRGRDLADVIHEWGGDPDDVQALVRAHLERRAALGDESSLFLMSPLDERGVADRLAALGAPISTGILGLAKILDARRAAELAAAALDPLGRVSVRAHATREGAFELTGPRGSCSLSIDDLADLLFCARAERHLASECATHLGVENRSLPFAPFAWGLDSI